MVMVMVLDGALNFGSYRVCLHAHDEPRRRRAGRNTMGMLEGVADGLGERLRRCGLMRLVEPLDGDEVRLAAWPG
jgi:hypothetical protein